MRSKGVFIISDDNYFLVYKESNHELIKKYKLTVSKSNSTEELEILNFKVSPNEKYLCFIVGKQLIKSIEELHELFIFEVGDDDLNFIKICKNHLSKDLRMYSREFVFEKTDPLE